MIEPAIRAFGLCVANLVVIVAAAFNKQIDRNENATPANQVELPPQGLDYVLLRRLPSVCRRLSRFPGVFARARAVVADRVRRG